MPRRGQGTLTSVYAAQAKRTTALTIRDSTEFSVHRVIRLPKGSSMVTPLPSLDLEDKMSRLRARRSSKIDGNTLTEDFAVSLPSGVISPENFGDFGKATRSVDDGFTAVVRVTPPKGVTFGADKEKKPAAKKK